MRPPVDEAATTLPRARAHVLLTGVTGFVGKVVLSDLIRRRDELGLTGVTVIVREKRAKDGRTLPPAQRFAESVAPAQVFADLPSGWQSFVTVAVGNLERPGCGLSDEDRALVLSTTTHVIHCAASVEFDLPIADATKANVTSALNVLELARACPRLVGMVDTSTAYVSPWRPGPIREELVHLPRPAEELYAAIQGGARPEREYLEETGHPNTYTYTKSIAEHLLCERRGEVPLAIVRPSVISTSWRSPFPGWVDSPAALAGVLLYVSMGVIPAFAGHPGTRLDVIPVDVVSRVLIDTAFIHRFPQPGERVPIRFAAVGVKQALRVDTIVSTLVQFFRTRPGSKKIGRFFIGTTRHGQAQKDLVRRAVPNAAMKILLKLFKQDRDLRRLTRMDDTVAYLNQAFAYFTHHTFDFQPKEPCVPPSFRPDEYIGIVCRGLYRFLLKKDETEVSLAGALHEDSSDDVRWALEKPDGNGTVRALGIGMRKVLRQCTDRVTWDRLSFERAVDATAPDSIYILAPSHRSYFDFLLMAYLCFQHPELGIPIPHIAAADDFSRIPVLGNILAKAGAFYIPRGKGGEAPEVNEQLHRFAADPGSLMFFVEGQRSRSRLTLPPKRGLLRGLQATGRSFTILPISMAYDRVPEEGALEKELTGGERAGMSLAAVLRWLANLARDRVHLGHVHISCGTPLVLDGDTDVRALSERIVAELQRNTAATRFHLRMFLASTELDKQGVTEQWLTEAIVRRGGRVLDSTLPAEKGSPALDQSLRNQWMHLFFSDAKALYPGDPIVAHYVERHAWTPLHDRPEIEDPRVKLVVDALFARVRGDYSLTAQTLKSPAHLEQLTPQAIVRTQRQSLVPGVEDALDFLQQHGALQTQSDGTATWQADAAVLQALFEVQDSSVGRHPE